MPRPTAWEVSFRQDGEQHHIIASGSTQVGSSSRSLASSSIGNSENPAKRKHEAPHESRIPSGKQHAQSGGSKTSENNRERYHPHHDEIIETPDLNLPGEDPDLDIRVDGKPVRLLSDFTIFDPTQQMGFISLSYLDGEDDSDRDPHLEAAGLVKSVVRNDEDAGQEDDLEESSDAVQLRLGAIIGYSVEYMIPNDPMYIETDYAWYMLDQPSLPYRLWFRKFYEPHRIAQKVITLVSSQRDLSYPDLLTKCQSYDNLLQKWISKEDVLKAAPVIQDVLNKVDNDLRGTPSLKNLLDKGASTRVGDQQGRISSSIPRRRSRNQSGRGPPRPPKGNLDLWVLRPENQNPTTVTPLVATLSEAWVQTQLIVVGSRPVPSRPPPPSEEECRRDRLQRLLSQVLRPEGKIDISYRHRLTPRSAYLRSFCRGMKTFKVGDVLLTPIGDDGIRKAPEVPTDLDQLASDAAIQDFFWFGKAIYIDSERQTVHVQWFDHASKTYLQEIADSRELFLCDRCSTIPLASIAGLAVVRRLNPAEDVSQFKKDEFFYKFAWNHIDGSITDINDDREQVAACHEPPNNCPACLLDAQQVDESHGTIFNKGSAVTRLGVVYHHYDFVYLLADDDTPCLLGQILEIHAPRRGEEPQVTVRRLGRFDEIIRRFRRDDIKDSRHLFLTDVEEVYALNFVIGLAYVAHQDSIHSLTKWKAASPHHFFLRFLFPTLSPGSWNEATVLHLDDIPSCKVCFEDKISQMKATDKFLHFMADKPLRTFDPFGGVGTFGLGLESSGCIKVTHAAEITPSAAQTLKNNSPGTIVYNQCANKILQYAIKTKEGHKPEIPLDIDGTDPMPPPPKPEEIDCIIAGFPCQPHSALNMYQKANDLKSILILNVLSWVDFLRPRFCIFENVRGFLRYNLNATQAGRYRVEGGIQMGGLKLVVRCLIAMGYQVRFALLQAGHYGTPQSRVRFFLLAAQHGEPLPDFPQPTHFFPVVDALEIKMPNGDRFRPIITHRGTMPHRFITIDDAIGDLTQFDWRPSADSKLGNAKRQELQQRREDQIPDRKVDRKLGHCGYNGVVRYRHEPKTCYQEESRRKPATNLQHFTRCLDPKSVDRVIHIPLQGGADYRQLSPIHWKWHFSDPLSSTARRGFRPGPYGRLDKDRYFMTTVTNVGPEAKQSRVLHPECYRIVTVRELARSQGFPDWFTFFARDNNVITMHREIGNAVPWQVSTALGYELRNALFKRWQTRREDEAPYGNDVEVIEID